ncbi:hypothetical protein D9M71_396420 [compost metagenome]
MYRGSAPGIGRGMGGVQGFFDVFGSGAGEFGNRLAIHRRCVGEVLTFYRRYELAADVIPVTALEGNNGAFGTGMCITHGEYLLVLVELWSAAVAPEKCRAKVRPAPYTPG